jgi:hypothetical protein
LRAVCAIAAVSAGALAGGCGYYSTTSRTAKDIKSIYVPFFENRTPEPNLEITVTEKVIDNLVADNTLAVTVEDDADAVLEGAIINFINRPFSFDNELNAQEYNILIKVEATLFNRRKNEPIWERKVFSGDGQYFVDVSGEEAQTFDGAVEESIREITEQILNITVQDW